MVGGEGRRRSAAPELGQVLSEHLPPMPLRPFVACVWVHTVSSDSPPYEHTTAPNGCGELRCELGRLRLIGPTSHPTTNVLVPGTTVVGLRFRPTALSAIVGVPATELLDANVDADDVLPLRGTLVREQLVGARSPEVAVATLQAAASELVKATPRVDQIATAAVASLVRDPTAPIASVAAELFVSERTLRRRCEAAIGVSPKALQRFIRFRRFLVLSRLHANLAELAALSGFSDQAHLSRETRRLATQSPRELVDGIRRHCLTTHRHDVLCDPLVRA